MRTLLVATFILGLVLRFYHLGSVPPSLDWDEASLGWNAYSFATTGSDEYGNSHPVSIRSFNDYKPPLYVYASTPIISVLGLSEFSTRFLSALSGTLSVIALFYLVFWLTKRQKLALVASFFFATTPWSIHFSRGAFEANLALFLIICAAALFIRRSLMTSSLFFVASLYAYHSTRLFVPLFGLFASTLFWRSIWRKRKSVIVAGFLAILVLLPLVRSTLLVGGPQARLSTVSVFSSDLSRPLLVKTILQNELAHFSFNFLFLNGDDNNRHHAPDTGMLLLIFAPLLLAGFYSVAKKRPSWWPILAIWIILAPLPAAITFDSPHAIRALNFLPPLVIISAYGLLNFKKKISLSFIFLITANLLLYLNRYFVHLPVEYAASWQYGYKELVKEVLAVEKNYDQVYITPAYDQPYIYFLFYGRVAPIIKNNTFFYQAFDKYVFKNYCALTTLPPEKRILVVLAPHENCSGVRIIKTLNYPDGAPVFKIAEKL